MEVARDKLQKSKKSDNAAKSMPIEGEPKEEPMQKSRCERRSQVRGDRNKEREKERIKSRGCDWDRNSTGKLKEEAQRDSDQIKDRRDCSKDRTKDDSGWSVNPFPCLSTISGIYPSPELLCEFTSFYL